MTENEETSLQERVLAEQDITDEMRIQFAMDEFYENMKGFDNSIDKLRRIKLMRNNIVNMMDTYLKKFNNRLIMQEFYEKLQKAKAKATNNGKINKYTQFMNEMRVMQEYKGIRENIAEKLGEQLFELFKNSKNSEVIPRDIHTETNDTE